MASSKKQAGSSNRASVRKNTKAQKEELIEQQQQLQFKREIQLWIVVAVSLLLFISNLGVGGVVGGFLSGVLFGMVGLVAYVFPVLLLIFTFFAEANKGNFLARIKLVAAILMTVFVCALLGLFLTNAKETSPAAAFMVGFNEKNGGGMIGGTLAYIFANWFGMAGAYIISVVGLIISFVMLTGRLAMHSMQRKSAQVYESAKVHHEEWSRERQQRRLDRKAEGFFVEDYTVGPSGTGGSSLQNIGNENSLEQPDIAERSGISLAAELSQVQKTGWEITEPVQPQQASRMGTGQVPSQKTGWEITEPVQPQQVSLMGAGQVPSQKTGWEITEPVQPQQASRMGTGQVPSQKTGWEITEPVQPQPASRMGAGQVPSQKTGWEITEPVQPQPASRMGTGQVQSQKTGWEITEPVQAQQASGTAGRGRKRKRRRTDSMMELQPGMEFEEPELEEFAQIESSAQESAPKQNLFEPKITGYVVKSIRPEMEESAQNESGSGAEKLYGSLDSETKSATVKLYGSPDNEMKSATVKLYGSLDNDRKSGTAKLYGSMEPETVSEDEKNSASQEVDVREMLERIRGGLETEAESIRTGREDTTGYGVEDASHYESVEDTEEESSLDQMDSPISEKPEMERTGRTRVSSEPQDGSAQGRSRRTADRTPTASRGREAKNSGEADEELVIPDIEEAEPIREYVYPPIGLLHRMESKGGGNLEIELRETAMKLQQTLKTFGVNVTVTDISCGPAVTRYEIQPEMGVKVSKIVNLSDDIKLNLAAEDIRIEAPIPGKAAVGIEVPNKENVMVSFRELIESPEFQQSKSKISFAVGRDIAGKVKVADIAKMPHLLIAGATGSGKSVCINTIIMSILYKADPNEVKLIMIDPKVVELSVYNGIPHLMIPVVTDPKKAAAALNWAVQEMTDRYNRFAETSVRKFEEYNAKIDRIEVPEGQERPKKMCQLVIIVDELADLMMVASKEVEDAICRLAQLARAAGIHLVIATQRPSVNVITGLIKANMPSRIAFAVSSGIDSRTILDMNGAEKLLGKGDMLFDPQGVPKPLRVQGAFVSDDEVTSVVDFLKENNGDASYSRDVQQKMESLGDSGNTTVITEDEPDDGRDNYFYEAAQIIVDKEKASIGMLQRYLKIGFNRAARIMDQLEEAGIVGPEEGTKPRRVLMSPEEFQQLADAM